MKFYVQIRRGGFKVAGPWGNKGPEFLTIEEAKKFVSGVSQQASELNCVIDYQIIDENYKIILEG